MKFLRFFTFWGRLMNQFERCLNFESYFVMSEMEVQFRKDGKMFIWKNGRKKWMRKLRFNCEDLHKEMSVKHQSNNKEGNKRNKILGKDCAIRNRHAWMNSFPWTKSDEQVPLQFIGTSAPHLHSQRSLQFTNLLLGTCTPWYILLYFI